MSVQQHQMLSLADQVFEVIEKDILVGTYEKGEVLTEARLCDQLRVSRTPVREAIKRLCQEHLLEVTPKGVSVIGISAEDILDIYEIRYRLEGLAARRAVENITPEALKEMEETLELQQFYASKQDLESMKNMDSLFHQDIYRFCGSNPLKYTLEPLVMRIVKYSKASISVPDRAARSLEEHWAIYNAIADRDADRAEQLMKNHIYAASASLLKELGRELRRD